MTFDQCQLGLVSKKDKKPVKKRTTIKTNSRCLVDLLKDKQCDNSHVHCRIQGSEGAWACNVIVCCLLFILDGCMWLTFHDVLCFFYCSLALSVKLSALQQCFVAGVLLLLLLWSLLLWLLLLLCPCSFGWLGGEKRSSYAAKYPDGLCNIIAEAAVREWNNRTQ